MSHHDACTDVSLLALSGGKKFRQTEAKVDTSVAFLVVTFLTSRKQTKNCRSGLPRGAFFAIFHHFCENDEDCEKATNFLSPDPAFFVIVTFETITLLTRGPFPDGQIDENEQPTIIRETFFRL